MSDAVSDAPSSRSNASSSAGSDAIDGISPEAAAALAALAGGPAAAGGPEDGYKKVSCIGEGAFGAVWLARRKEDGGHVALKEVPRMRVMGSEKDVRRLWDERAVLLEVTSARKDLAETSTVPPALVGAAVFFATRSCLCFAMDLVEGAPLNDHVRRAGENASGGAIGLTETAACWYACEVASALDWLHRRGWIYRDLKLSNVVICARTGRARLVDFGFARRTDRADSVVGTLHTMAPEVIELGLAAMEEGEGRDEAGNSHSYGSSVDWWSLGVLLFEVLSGTAPFGYHDDVCLEGKTILEKQRKCSILGLPWPDNAARGAGVGDAARKAAAHMLEFHPDRRLGARDGVAELRSDCAFFAACDWTAVMSRDAPGPAFDAELGVTVERAMEHPTRARRQGGGTMPVEDPDPFEGF